MTTTALAQLATINKQTFAKGGILDGASHAMGGIQTQFGELEGGEAVINKRSTAMFKDELSAINEAGGGRSFGSRPSRMTKGAEVNVNIENFSGDEDSIEKLKNGLYELFSSGVVSDSVFA